MRLAVALLAVSGVCQSVEPGFEPLFDGRTLEGWITLPRNEPTGAWKAAGSILYVEGRPGNLATDRDYGDFDLRLEWKVGPLGNSGVFYRVPDGGSATRGSIEYQLADNARQASQSHPNRRSGAAYGLYAPTRTCDRPTGDWNSLRIVVRDSAAAHWLNGCKVAEFRIGGEDFSRRAAMKFPNEEDFAKSRTGRIVLQDHGSAVWFRNIRIRDLGQSDPTSRDRDSPEAP